MKRIGIYSGTFNPVHAGHVAFALQAAEIARLDKLYFLPERKPRNKVGVEHFAHRVAMLKQAAKPYNNFGVLEFDDVSFSIQRTLPRLQQLFPDAELVFLIGSDIVPSLAAWPHAARLFEQHELVVGMRKDQNVSETKHIITTWPSSPKVMLINSYAPDVSSGAIREGLQTQKPVKGLLKSVAKYSNHHWLYVSVG